MSNYEQAPLLLSKGEKDKKGLFAYRPHELESAICCCLGSRDIVALKTMLFFTGNSNEGDFRVSQKTIYERMNISEKPYYQARKKLQSMGWIHYDEAQKVIYVNYDKIYSDYKKYLRGKEGGSDNSPERTTTDGVAVMKALSGQSSENDVNCSDDSLQDGCKDRYNNINNNINNTINKKIREKKSGSAGAAIAALPPEFIDKALEYRNDREHWNEYYNAIENWVYENLSRSGFSVGSPEYKEQYEEFAKVANRCLAILHGRTDSFEEQGGKSKYNLNGY